MNPRAYYNENNKYAAIWLENLIQAGHIAPGDVDSRSIVDVRPKDLRGYTQCHFFAGIGGWSASLRRSGVPDNRKVWSGSCPCQPFSLAGKTKGFEDERHLWPVWHELIKECGPAMVLGEQVASAIDWLSLVRSDLEALGYAVGAIPIEAASAGAGHLRDRIFFVANSGSARRVRLVTGSDIGKVGQGRLCSPKDMLSIVDSPFEQTNRRPQPLLRKLDDGVPQRMDKLCAFGNAIDLRATTQFINAALG